MGLLMKIFTWWDGATIGTALWSARNGVRVGEDAEGNVYSEAKKVDPWLGYKRRWVIYNGPNDARRVPTEWHGWLHHQVDGRPDESLPPQRIWEKPPVPNLTGSREAYRPAGALEAGGVRAPATGDYEAWVP